MAKKTKRDSVSTVGKKLIKANKNLAVQAKAIVKQKHFEKELTKARILAEHATVRAEAARKKAEIATQIARDAVNAKQQFLSNMSHEIRTPMNAIIGFTKVVLKTELTAKQREYVTAIRISGDALIVLINDILDLAKVDAGKMTFERAPFKMEASMFEMLHLFEEKVREKNLLLKNEYDSRIPQVLIGDVSRLHQIFMNLVSNAIKFTSEGTISIKTHLISENETSVFIEFSVSDSGIGIPSDKIRHIFEKYQQATTATSRLYGGTGLGLAIVKQLVEAQGGSLKVESKINRGSVFSFILEYQKATSETVFEPEVIEIDPEIKHIKVLVVEDIVLNQLLMKTLLDDFGFERDIAGDGKIAIQMLKKNSYDIILMDLQMPVMNGFETTLYIRNVMKLTIPIVAVTADVTTADLEKCRKAGMDDYIAKPVDEKLLYSKLVKLVHKGMSPRGQKAPVAEVLVPVKRLLIDLTYLKNRTKSNPVLMKEMISLYLAQTPLLLKSIRTGLQNGDWEMLHAAAHKMIPSFAIMGVSSEFEAMAKRLQDIAAIQLKPEEVSSLVSQLEEACDQVFLELRKEYELIKR